MIYTKLYVKEKKETMASILISGEEKHYITTGVEEDFRNDGRTCEDYRKVCVKTRVLSTTNGSSEVTLVIYFFFTFYLCHLNLNNYRMMFRVLTVVKCD